MRGPRPGRCPGTPASRRGRWSRSPGVRIAAAEALGGIGQEAKAAVPALQEALKDKDTGFRRGAAWALVRIDWQSEAAAAAAQVVVEGFNEHPYMALELLRRVRAPPPVSRR